MTKQSSGAPPNEVVQEFPAGASMQTAWRVRFGHATGKGLFITGAWFKRGPTQPWMQVLYDARVADLFVPYHSGSPRYYDLSSFNFDLVPANANDRGCCGTILDSFVIKEVIDYGPAWKDDEQVRRGQELVLWATIDAANYNYILRYGFRDDGTITFRSGATARNLPGREMEAHMHNALWRLDIDLNGASHDSAMVMTHSENIAGLTASDSAVGFNGGKEGFVDWDPVNWTEIGVEDTQTLNTSGKHISYDLMPMRMGTARHKENFTHHDFWVTRYHGTDLNYTQLPTYIGDTESIVDNDIVVWTMSSMHHLPRQEDGRYEGEFWKGVALVMWGGFDLRPRNLFDGTPLHP
jgi:primary-amine oxidase